MENNMRKFNVGDLVMLATDQYLNLKHGSVGIILSVPDKSLFANVWFAEGIWAFPLRELEPLTKI